MNIKLTKHSHYLMALLVLVLLNALMHKLVSQIQIKFVLGAILGFLFLIVMVMWISFAFSKKDTIKEEKVLDKTDRGLKNILKEEMLVEKENYKNMGNQPTALDKAAKISIIAGASLVALSIVYYLVIFLPQKETNRLEQEKNKENMQKECAEYARGKACSDNDGGCDSSKYNFRLSKCLNEKGL